MDKSNSFISDNKIIIYHCSDSLVGLPTFGVGKSYNDYGVGFYCTEDKHKAELWSVGKNTNGFVNKYELDITGLRILKLDESNVVQWLAILANHRYFDEDEFMFPLRKMFIEKYLDVNVEDYDCIEGYRADDSYFSIVKNFFSNSIGLEDLYELLHLGSLGKQFVLKSSKAFNRLKFLDYEKCFKSSYYDEYKKIDIDARKMAKEIMYKSSLRTEITTVRDLLKEEI